MEPIRVGIMGLGRSGWDIHARLIDPLKDKYQIVAVVDRLPERRAEAVERWGCSAYPEVEELLANDDIELVIVALPSYLHAGVSIAALEAGKHVVCEKPMATSLEDADAMVAADQAAETVLSIFQNRRYNPDFVKVQEIIDSGILGRIVQIRLSESKFGRRWDWQTQKQFGGGTLNNTGPHHLDMALQLFGPTEPEISVHLDRTLTLGDADDHVKLVLQADGRPTIDIEVSSVCAYPGETWNIMGTQGGLAGTTKELRWKFFDPVELPPCELDFAPTPDRGYNREQIPWQEGSWSVEEDTGPGYTGYYLDLYETIRNGAPLVITAESARRNVWLQEECHKVAGL